MSVLPNMKEKLHSPYCTVPFWVICSFLCTHRGVLTDSGLYRAVRVFSVCVVDVTGTQDPGLHRAVVCVVGLCTACVL